VRENRHGEHDDRDETDDVGWQKARATRLMITLDGLRMLSKVGPDKRTFRDNA